MPAYEFKCPTCNSRQEIHQSIAGNASTPSPPTCACGAMTKRVFSFATTPIFEEHFNMTVGEVVHSKADMASKLERKADDIFKQTGVASDFRVVDIADRPPTAAQADLASSKALESGKRDAKIIA